MNKNTTVQITLIGMFTAIAAVISALPIGINILGVPATLQTFAMAFLGFMLGKKNGTIAVAIYIVMGLAGIPVFNGFTAGPSILFGMTGGFLFGFLALSFLCGLAGETKNIVLKILFSVSGLIICHVIGVLQFAFIMEMNVAASAAAVSIPYLPKDVLSVFLAYGLALAIRKALRTSKISPDMQY